MRFHYTYQIIVFLNMIVSHSFRGIAISLLSRNNTSILMNCFFLIMRDIH